MAHKHGFSVDTSCDCGIMLSEYTQALNDELQEVKRIVNSYVERNAKLAETILKIREVLKNETNY